MVIYRKLLPRTKKRGVFYLSLKICSLNRLASYDEYPPDTLTDRWTDRHECTHTHTHRLALTCPPAHTSRSRGPSEPCRTGSLSSRATPALEPWCSHT